MPRRDPRSGAPRSDRSARSRRAAGIEALRRRLYEQGAGGGDLDRYLQRRKDRTRTRTRPRRVGAVAVPTVVVLLAVAVAAIAVPAPLQPRPRRTPSGSVLVPRAVPGLSTGIAVMDLLADVGADGPSAAQRRRFAALVSASSVESGAADALVLGGGGTGAVSARLRSLGITAQGRAATVVVATPSGRYSWRLIGRAGSGGSAVIAAARSLQPTVVTGCTVEMPPTTPAESLRIQAPPGEPLLYAVVVTG